MSKQSKQRRKAATAKTVTAIHKAGNRGPVATQKTNGKKKAWYLIGDDNNGRKRQV